MYLIGQDNQAEFTKNFKIWCVIGSFECLYKGFVWINVVTEECLYVLNERLFVYVWMLILQKLGA